MKREPKKKRRKKYILVILLILAVILVAAFLMIRNFFHRPQIAPATPSDSAVVETAKGRIRGSEENGIYQYLGVPYAQAEERFVPAVEVQEWEGILDASEVGPMSPQSSMLGMSGGGQEGTDNNCQNLNIWTPGTNDGEKRAVMVWLHGGGFSTGSANCGL